MTKTDDAEHRARLLVLGAGGGQPKLPPRRLRPKTVQSVLSEELIAIEKETKRLEDGPTTPSL